MRNRLLVEWLLVATLAIGAVLLLVGSRLTLRSDNVIYDLLMRARQPLASDVTIVAIDDDSLKLLGKWPWPRDIHARLLEKLSAAGPKAIGYDVLFAEPSVADGSLAQAVHAAGNVVLPMTFAIPGDNGAAFAAQLPAEPLASSARAIGHVDLVPDADGIVRGLSLLAGNADHRWPAFAEQLFVVAYGRASAAFLRSGESALPRSGFGMSPPVLIRFAVSGDAHPTVPFASVLRGDVPPELLRNRLILIGSTAAGSGDRYPVPIGGMSGVEVLANLLDTLAADRAVRVAPVGLTLVFAIVPVALLLGAVLVFSPRANLILGAGLIAGVFGVSAMLLIAADLWVPPMPALAGLLIVYPLWAWRRLAAASAYMTAELEQLGGELDQLPIGSPIPVNTGLTEPVGRQSIVLNGAIRRVRDLRRFFSDSLQSLPDATIIADNEGSVLVANRSARALFGIGESEQPNSGARSWRSLIAELSPSRELGPGDSDAEIVTGDGRTFAVRSTHLSDSEGSPLGWIVRLTDITEIRLAIRHREDALQLLSHDMRSPQAAILALLDQLPDGDSGVGTRIASHALRTLKLAEDFVQLARAEAHAYADELLDFASLLVEAADDQWPLAAQKKIRIVTPDDEAEMLVRGDRTLLSRTLCNLIGNAIQYSPPGTEIRCMIEEERGGDGVRLMCCRIADQGEGIAPENLDAIFQPFHRSSRGPGIGLGLAFVKTVVARHGGTVEVSSKVGVGTTFAVRIPLAADV